MFYSNIELIYFPNWSIYSKLSKDANLLNSEWVECTGHWWFEYFNTGKCLSKKYRVNTISYTNMMSKFTQSVNLLKRLKVRTKQFP
jgi:nitrite reductase/ring-hydroxylating ferredoxin subunit